MRYGFFGWLVKTAFSDTAFAYMGKEFSSMESELWLMESEEAVNNRNAANALTMVFRSLIGR